MTLINFFRILFARKTSLKDFEWQFIAGLSIDAFLGAILVAVMIAKGMIK